MDEILRNISLKDISVAVADLVMPRICVVCGARLGLRERHLCLGCLADMPYSHFWEYEHNVMADKFNRQIRDNVRDGVREEYACAATLMFYNSESGYKLIPQSLKYRHNLSLGRFFASLLGRKLAASEFYQGVDVVIPVPLHWRRRLLRGYNQSEVIASEIASALGARMEKSVLRRRRYTRTQTKMAVGEKSTNVAGAFSATGHLNASHVLLVDDTFTTGATLAACHAALRDILPPSVRISAVTLAYVRES